MLWNEKWIATPRRLGADNWIDRSGLDEGRSSPPAIGGKRGADWLSSNWKRRYLGKRRAGSWSLGTEPPTVTASLMRATSSRTHVSLPHSSASSVLSVCAVSVCTPIRLTVELLQIPTRCVNFHSEVHTVNYRILAYIFIYLYIILEELGSIKKWSLSARKCWKRKISRRPQLDRLDRLLPARLEWIIRLRYRPWRRRFPFLSPISAAWVDCGCSRRLRILIRLSLECSSGLPASAYRSCIRQRASLMRHPRRSYIISSSRWSSVTSNFTSTRSIHINSSRSRSSSNSLIHRAEVHPLDCLRPHRRRPASTIIQTSTKLVIWARFGFIKINLLSVRCISVGSQYQYPSITLGLRTVIESMQTESIFTSPHHNQQ